MPPGQYQYPAPQQQPPGPQDPYQFFMSPTPPPRRPLSFGGSMRKRILTVAVGFGALLILFMIASSLFSGHDTNKTNLISIAQKQQEMLRISNNARNNSSLQSSAMLNFSATAISTLTSEQGQLLTYLRKNGTKVSNNQLALAQSAQTDSALSSAKAADTFDQTYASIMKSQLTSYQAALHSTYETAAGPIERQLLTDDYNAATLLLQQLGQQ